MGELPPNLVEKRIKHVLRELRERLGYVCEGVSYREIYDYVTGETPTGDTVSFNEIIYNKYYFIHEIVETCELKKKGIRITRETVVLHYPTVYMAHLTALEVELAYACMNRDIKWIEERLNTVLSQIDFDIRILSNYLNTEDIKQIKESIGKIMKKFTKCEA
jgi:hypothetical protein